ncbi:MAG: hypothetical protein WBD72_14905, partial [Candidatus Acidiferrum sp.]
PYVAVALRNVVPDQQEAIFDQKLCLLASLLKSIVTDVATNVDSKRLTLDLSPLEATFTRKLGRGLVGGGMHGANA